MTATTEPMIGTYPLSAGSGRAGLAATVDSPVAHRQAAAAGRRSCRDLPGVMSR